MKKSQMDLFSIEKIELSKLQSKDQKTFVRYKREIERLEQLLRTDIEKCDKFVLRYNQQIVPLNEKIANKKNAYRELCHQLS